MYKMLGFVSLTNFRASSNVMMILYQMLAINLTVCFYYVLEIIGADERIRTFTTCVTSS